MFGHRKREQVLIRQEQERISSYIINNITMVDGSRIRKVEFIEFQKNKKTENWIITATINDRYDISFKENNFKGEIRTSNYSPTELKVSNSIDLNDNTVNIKIIYCDKDKDK